MFVILKITKFDGMHGLATFFFRDIVCRNIKYKPSSSISKKKEKSLPFFFAKIQHFKVTLAFLVYTASTTPN